jgi:hypothetical protein
MKDGGGTDLRFSFSELCDCSESFPTFPFNPLNWGNSILDFFQAPSFALFSKALLVVGLGP